VLPGAAPTPGSPGNGSPGNGRASHQQRPTSNSSRSTRNFEVDRTLSYIKQPTGSLKRLSVVSGVRRLQKVGADGKLTTSPLSDTDIKRFTQLVRESIGLKDDRGDKARRHQPGFQDQSAHTAGRRLPLWQTPWVTNSRSRS